MIHAYLFLEPVRGASHDRDGHGPNFQDHMHRINRTSGAHITVSYSQSTYSLNFNLASWHPNSKLICHSTQHNSKELFPCRSTIPSMTKWDTTSSIGGSVTDHVAFGIPSLVLSKEP